MAEEPMNETKYILKALKQLLEKQDSGPTFCARICEPDMYNGDYSLDSVVSWVRSIERYLELVHLGEHQWVDYTVTLLCDEADTWWHQ